MELSHLPLEILQLILRHCTTPSFLQVVSTCHKLWDLASKSREVVLHHLFQVPGIKLGLDDFSTSTEELFLGFGRRAALHLFGVNLHADRTDFRFRNSQINLSASSLARFSSPNVALVIGDKVRLYDVRNGEAVLCRDLPSPFWDREGAAVLKVAFSQLGDVAVLHSNPKDHDYGTENDLNLRESNPFIIRAQETNREELFLIHYRVCARCDAPATGNPVVYRIFSHKGYVPVSLAVFSRTRMAIVLSRGFMSRETDWALTETAVVLFDTRKLSGSTCYTYSGDHSHLQGKAFLHEGGTVRFEVLYPPRGNEDASNLIPVALGLPLPDALRPPPLEIAFYQYGARLKCYPASHLVPFHRIDAVNFSQSGIPVERFGIEGLEFTVDDPFFGTHEAYTDQVTSDRYCLSNYLSLGTADCHGSMIACIFRSRSRVDHDECRHLIDLDVHQASSSYNKIVARLWGFKQASTSLPGVFAYSEKGSRIAIAHWDKIYVWAVNGQHLVEDDQGSRYYDKVWDGNMGCDVVELMPILLRAGSVVRKMIFYEKEDELICLTTAGLQVWNLGPSGTGKRETRFLDDPVTDAAKGEASETVEAEDVEIIETKVFIEQSSRDASGASVQIEPKPEIPIQPSQQIEVPFVSLEDAPVTITASYA